MHRNRQICKQAGRSLKLTYYVNIITLVKTPKTKDQMKNRKMYLRYFSMLILFSISAVIIAQETRSDTSYVPEVGQKGKDVVWVPSPDELVEAMLNIAKVNSDDYLIDLGSGDGRTVIAAAKKGAHALGIEFNPDLVALSKRNAANEGVSDFAEFREGDLYNCDLSPATVITMFLLPEINLKLRPKILDLKPGTRVVTNTFTMGEWEADYEVTTDADWNTWNSAYLWIVPARVEGSWKMGSSELNIQQKYQIIRGTLTMDGKSFVITNGRLSGNDITFEAAGGLYTGTLKGDSMFGTVTIDSNKSDWSATR
jgi:precorrin-6B methylase 2